MNRKTVRPKHVLFCTFYCGFGQRPKNPDGQQSLLHELVEKSCVCLFIQGVASRGSVAVINPHSRINRQCRSSVHRLMQFGAERLRSPQGRKAARPPGPGRAGLGRTLPVVGVESRRVVPCVGLASLVNALSIKSTTLRRRR